MPSNLKNDIQPVMTKKLSYIFALAAGLAVGNLYWAQPLLAQIAESFMVSKSDAGILITATQMGYAIGILLIVPLGDFIQRKRLIPTVMGLSVIALLACAVSPSFTALAAALAAMGLTTVSGQIILPLAGDLAEPETRGRYVGIVSSGLMTGILASRTISGLVANLFGWRAIYLLAAVLNLILMLIMMKVIPVMHQRVNIAYSKLIGSVFISVVKVPTLFRVMLMSGLGFVAFNMFWTALTFLLSGEPFGFTTFQIGLVSLAGLVAVVASQGVGKLVDRGLSIPATGFFFGIILFGSALMIISGKSLILVIICAAAISLGSQGVGILNQTRVFSLSPENRSRLNTAYVVNNFIFGAAGSALTTVLWNKGGWIAVAIGCCIVMLMSLTVWAVSIPAYKKSDAER